MSTISNNPLASMLNSAFDKFDRNGDGKLNRAEFESFNEILKPGTATDDLGRPLVNYEENMDQNGDDSVTKDEMNSTTVLMPASLTDSSFSQMISTLKSRPERKRHSLLPSLQPTRATQPRSDLSYGDQDTARAATTVRRRPVSLTAVMPRQDSRVTPRPCA